MDKKQQNKIAFLGSALLGLGSMAVIATAAHVTSQTTTELTDVTERIPYTTQFEYDDNAREGVNTTKQVGRDGSALVTYEVTKDYRGVETGRIRVNVQVLTDPQEEIIIKGTKKIYTCSDGTEYEVAAERDECDQKIAWQKSRDQALAACNADSTKTNCWYDAYPGTTIHYTERPTYTAPSNNSSSANNSSSGSSSSGSSSSNSTGGSYNGGSSSTNSSSGVRTGAVCKDGTRSSATGRGACSHHGGVSYWLYR